MTTSQPDPTAENPTGPTPAPTPDDAPEPAFDQPTQDELREQQAQADEEVDRVLQGSISDVREWVADDPDRARRALDRENASGSPRSTLTAHLESLSARPAD